jgi:hypothetical protein
MSSRPKSSDAPVVSFPVAYFDEAICNAKEALSFIDIGRELVEGFYLKKEPVSLEKVLELRKLLYGIEVKFQAMVWNLSGGPKKDDFPF